MAVNTSREEWKIYQNVFDKFTIALIRKLISQDYFEELEMPLAVGKEANVFIAKTKDQNRVIVKIYRLENCSFNKMFDYIKQDPRYLSMRKNRRDIVFSWVQREYRNLLLAREAINVPTPIIFKNNILVLEMIGEPSPMLKDKKPKNPKKFLDLILKDVISILLSNISIVVTLLYLFLKAFSICGLLILILIFLWVGCNVYSV